MMRVDKWLWTARLFKTRSLAAEAVKGGRVHVNGIAVKPGRELKLGDELEVTVGQTRRTVIVQGEAPRRVSAPAAAELYVETEQSVALRETQAEMRRLGSPIDLGGRPTKRDRRRFEAGLRHRLGTALEGQPPIEEHAEEQGGG